MSNKKIARAWKNPEFRASLSKSELDAMPENPAGAIELTDEALDNANGGGLSLWTFCRTQCGVYCTVVGPSGGGLSSGGGFGYTAVVARLSL